MPRRPDPKNLPTGLSVRPNSDGSYTYVARFKDPRTKKWRQRRVGSDRRVAERELKKLQQTGGPREKAKKLESLTVTEAIDAYLERVEERQEPPKTFKEMRGILRFYVCERIGFMRLVEVTVYDIIQWSAGLYELPGAKGRALSANRVHSIFATANTAFISIAKHHRREGGDWTSPFADLEDKERPQKVHNPRPPIPRDVVLRLTADPAIEPRSRVMWTLLAYTGMRFMEAAGLRWKDYDAAYEPLGRILLTGQGRDNEPLKEGRGVIKRIPVHPFLAAMLGYWWREGFERDQGRPPTPSDLVVPSTVGTVRRADHSLVQLRKSYRIIGVRDDDYLPQHCFRHSFATFCSEWGGGEWVKKVTHKSKGDDAFERFYLHPNWRAMCHAVSSLNYGTHELGDDPSTVDFASALGLDVAPNVAPTKQPLQDAEIMTLLEGGAGRGTRHLPYEVWALPGALRDEDRGLRRDRQVHRRLL